MQQSIAVECSEEFVLPALKVCVDVLIIVAFTSLYHRSSPKHDHCIEDPLANSTEMLILLVAKSKDSKRDALQMANASTTASCEGFRHHFSRPAHA